uniref:Uncharacterized protein n=1 Tax=Chenopodium quinoa TaxID=63459 RepID=A0A803MNU3_CHEQI
MDPEDGHMNEASPAKIAFLARLAEAEEREEETAQELNTVCHASSSADVEPLAAQNDPKWIDIKFERLADFCYYCGLLDHRDKECEKKEVDGDEKLEVVYQYGPWMRASPLKLCQASHATRDMEKRFLDKMCSSRRGCKKFVLRTRNVSGDSCADVVRECGKEGDVTSGEIVSVVNKEATLDNNLAVQNVSEWCDSNQIGKEGAGTLSQSKTDARKTVWKRVGWKTDGDLVMGEIESQNVSGVGVMRGASVWGIMEEELLRNANHLRASLMNYIVCKNGTGLLMLEQMSSRTGTYFHQKASTQCHVNNISGLYDDGGVWRSTKEKQEVTIEAYFAGLFQTCNPTEFDSALEGIGYVVTEEMNERLCHASIWCRLDRLWFGHPGILEGTMTRQPFLCPLDHVFEAIVPKKLVNSLHVLSSGPIGCPCSFKLDSSIEGFEAVSKGEGVAVGAGLEPGECLSGSWAGSGTQVVDIWCDKVTVFGAEIEKHNTRLHSIIMENINKDWTDAPHTAEEYIKGVVNFLDFAFLNSTMDTEEDDESEILCPCTKCVNRFWFPREEVFNHLIANRFNKRYKVWNFHGEGLTTGSSSRGDGHQCDNQNTLDNMDEMLNDIFRDVIGGSSSEAEELRMGPHESAKKFYKLLEDAREELYPGCVKKKNKGKKVSLDEDTLMKAHRYVLFNCDEISDYISEHQDLVNRQRSQGRRDKRSRWARAQEQSHDIGAWFKDRVREENVSKEIKALSQGPDYTVRSF